MECFHLEADTFTHTHEIKLKIVEKEKEEEEEKSRFCCRCFSHGTEKKHQSIWDSSAIDASEQASTNSILD